MPIIKTPTGQYFYVEKDTARVDRPPLLLIHGAGATHLTWPAALRRLDGWRVIAPDLPGHGRSSGGGRPTILAYADSVRELLDTLDIERAYIAGHSMGGAVALTMGLRLPERVAGLVLMATGPRLPVNSTLLETAQNDLEQMAALLNRWMWGAAASDDLKLLSTQQLLMTDPQVVYHDYEACDEFDIEGVLPTITCPALVIGGTADKMVPLALSETLHAGLPNSQFVKLEDAGHMLPLEQPEAVTQAVANWLETQSS